MPYDKLVKMEESFESDFSDTDASTLPASTPQKSLEICKTRFKEEKVDKKSNYNSIQTPSGDTFVIWDSKKEVARRCKFEILPNLHQKSSPSSKLVEFIKKGGGIVLDRTSLIPGSYENFVIKILDLDIVRAYVQEDCVKELLIPHDCFSSNYIWSKICQSLDGEVYGNLDLNLFRITPSAFEAYDANDILSGRLQWKDLTPLLPEKCPRPMQLKQVAMQFCPESLLFSPRSKSRRIYTRQESQLLLDKVCELNGHEQVISVQLYKIISQEHILDRTAASLREHFRKTIMPHVLADDGYYMLDSEDLRKFQRAQLKKRKLAVKEEKKQSVKKEPIMNHLS